MVWPWLDLTLPYVLSDEYVHPTAAETLKYWILLRVILLQDVAAMLCLMPEDDPVRQHGLFDFPVFKSAQFLAFVAEMKAKLELEAQPDNDPNLKAVEKALPGVNRQFTRTRTLINECHVAAEEAAFYSVEAAEEVSRVGERVSKLENAVREDAKQEGKKTRKLVRAFARCLKRGFDVFGDDDDSDGEEEAAAADASPSSPVGRRRIFPTLSESPETPSPPPAAAPLTPPPELEEEEGKAALFWCLWCLFWKF